LNKGTFTFNNPYRRKNKATCITTETYEITKPKEEDLPSIFNEVKNEKILKRRNTSTKGKNFNKNF